MKKFLFLIGASALAAAPAQAESLLFGGAQAGNERSTYGLLGVVTPLPGSNLGQGFVARGILSGYTYRYEGAPGDVDATGGGGEVSLGYQRSYTNKDWFGVYAGPAYRYTHLSPNDRTSDARGSDVTINLQAEGEHNLTKDFKVNLNGTYAVFGNNAYWTRARMLYRIDGALYMGPEAIVQGDGDYNAWALGVGLIGFDIGPRTTLGLTAGVRKVEDLSAGPYGGIEFGHNF